MSTAAVTRGRAGQTPARRRAVKPSTSLNGVRALSLPHIRRKRSRLHGWGVFAEEPINKNRRIIDYAGKLITNRQSERREDRYLRKGCIWVFRVNRNWSRDANVNGNIARFINHSCRPNCWVEVVDKTIWIRAARSIKAGEELTYDYNTEGDKTIPCRCRPGCETRL
jgi:SET domain-containing protein